MQRNYNYLYSKIVEGEGDMIGHIAYSLYKKSKIEYIENQKTEGKVVTDVELVPFNTISSSESSIESYKIKAEIILEGFISNLLEEELKTNKKQAKEEQSEILKEIIKPITPTFMKSVWQNVVSTLILSAIIALLVLVINFTMNGFWDTVGKMFNLKISTQKEMVNDTLSKPSNNIILNTKKTD